MKEKSNMSVKRRQRVSFLAEQIRSIRKAIETQKVWQKASIDPALNPVYWRRDDWGTLIYRYDYGNRHSLYGWEKDHIIPRAEGGSDELFNLRPLQWKNNLARTRTKRLSLRYTIRKVLARKPLRRRGQII